MSIIVYNINIFIPLSADDMQEDVWHNSSQMLKSTVKVAPISQSIYKLNIPTETNNQEN